jgi:hypothetical protein
LVTVVWVVGARYRRLVRAQWGGPGPFEPFGDGGDGDPSPFEPFGDGAGVWLAVLLLGGDLSGAAWAQEPKPRATLTGHARGVTSVAFSPDGKLLASGGASPMEGPGEIFLWDMEMGNKGKR